MTKLCTFYATKIQINDHEIDLNHDTEAKLGNLKNWLLIGVHIVSSVSARKLKCPAVLGSARNLHSSAWRELENSGSGSSLNQFALYIFYVVYLPNWKIENNVYQCLLGRSKQLSISRLCYVYLINKIINILHFNYCCNNRNTK